MSAPADKRTRARRTAALPGFTDKEVRASALREREISVRRLVVRFVLAGLPALAAAVVITAAASVRIGTALGVDDAKRVNWVASSLVEEQVLSDALLDGDPQAIAAVDRMVREYVIRGSLVRVKIWAPDGTIVYSDEARLIGQQFSLGGDELAVLTGELAVEAEPSDLAKPENVYETERRLLEVYRAIETPTGNRVLFESYFRYDDVSRTGRSLWSQFGPIAVGALLLLELVQIPFAISLARRLRENQRQRERLLQHALDSSDAERRRIASDLHDGAVQDLTGVSMQLAAAARQDLHAPSAEMLQDAGASIRHTVKSLRSMLVDIYPPNLYEEGLESALADLLGGLHNRGVHTSLDVDHGAVTRLNREGVGLMYRGAQEAIRNVTAHANATQVAVNLHTEGDECVLLVEDDGAGFDPEVLLRRERDGHVGLRSLTGLIRDAGGTVEVRSSPGGGTSVRIGLEG
ncbi:MAG: histidine kinase [Ilumatobacteraceae bacterium]